MSRLIAFHLPQFHPIPENDEWWGKGFTEWTNVTKAKPIYRGQYQPHLPADLGFYDLRLPETRKAQADLAKAYGIYGFCYYHYWFHGKQLLERPIKEILESGEPDFPFCLCWANESWSRRWDGSEHISLIQQQYSLEDSKNHIQALIPYFKDPRYIKIEGKPVFLIYRSQIIPDLEKHLAIFREEATKEGLELYLMRVESHNAIGAEYMQGFETAVEFQPFTHILKAFRKKFEFKSFWHNVIRKRSVKWIDWMIGKGKVYDQYWCLSYPSYLKYLFKNYEYPTSYKRFPCVAPSWDNTARKGKSSFSFYDSSPDQFQKWLEYHKNHFTPFSKEEDFIFVNAWNEWAEGDHLEPCQKWGHGYLKAVKNVFNAE
jgi:lipopolysaccharide biosynthesis protein